MELTKKVIKSLVLDVDGVLTTGQFLYTEDGKFAKVFGPHDNDGIKLVSTFVKVFAVTADKRGFEISKKRVATDMGIELTLVSESTRLPWLQEKFDLEETIYMGDGIYDAVIFNHVRYGIAPATAFYLARKNANFVTTSKAGDGAVAEACLHILEKFFELPENIRKIM